MDTDDILKLLLIALFILPGLFGRKKKKTEEYQHSDPEETYEYDDPFRDFETFDDESHFPQQTFETSQVPNQTQSNSFDIIPKEEGSSVFTKEQIEAALASIARNESGNDEISQNEITDSTNDADMNSDNDFLYDFDARHALIYSEIIKPKY
ncbi:MAG: hypothetical protein LBH30_03645 [Prevotellaceae bacterium]|jgi:hypothetical protein|nr:hypothetical protein [Prevotellaceae bacterium]